MKDQDYLKYLRPIRYLFCRKYNIKQAELDLLLFLKSEKYFTTKDIEDYASIIKWDWRRIQKLRNDEWIEVFRANRGRSCKVYKLTYKAQRMLTSFYNKLEGEDLPMTDSQNPLIRKKLSYTDTRYRDFLIKMTKELHDKNNAS